MNRYFCNQGNQTLSGATGTPPTVEPSTAYTTIGRIIARGIVAGSGRDVCTALHDDRWPVIAVRTVVIAVATVVAIWTVVVAISGSGTYANVRRATTCQQNNHQRGHQQGHYFQRFHKRVCLRSTFVTMTISRSKGLTLL